MNIDAITAKFDPALVVTLVALVAEIALFIFCRYKLRQPADPFKPRLVPYGGIMIFLALAIFVTIAHAISVYTGVEVAPKRSGKIR